MSDKKATLDTIINKEGIVIRWPKKKKEKLVVMDYLITKFEPGVEYKEIQVNIILKKMAQLWRPCTSTTRII